LVALSPQKNVRVVQEPRCSACVSSATGAGTSCTSRFVVVVVRDLAMTCCWLLRGRRLPAHRERADCRAQAVVCVARLWPVWGGHAPCLQASLSVYPFSHGLESRTTTHTRRPHHQFLSDFGVHKAEFNALLLPRGSINFGPETKAVGGGGSGNVYCCRVSPGCGLWLMWFLSLQPFLLQLRRRACAACLWLL
jgi:hypothetical protein